MAQQFNQNGPQSGGTAARLWHVIEHIAHLFHASRQAKFHARQALEHEARGDLDAANASRAAASFHAQNLKTRTGVGGFLHLFGGYFKTFK